MSSSKKIILIALIVVFGVIVAGAIIIHGISVRGLSDYDGEFRLPGLAEKVTVYRDGYGVPHIYAKNERDLYTAVGYCMAQDRLWQMDLLRRVTTGRLSEIFGEDLVDTDHLMRALRIPEKSRRMIERADQPLRDALQSFCNGVNYYIETHRDSLPPEFTILGYAPEPWRIEHSANLVCYMAWDLTMPWKNELGLLKIGLKVDRSRFEDLVPHIKDYKSVMYPDFAQLMEECDYRNALIAKTEVLENLGLRIFKGSNNWAVSGRKSVDGKPILANDMHLGLFAPGIWYQMHHSVEGGLDVTGVVLPGAPAVVCGHNRDIAWGMTNVMIDDMDFYIEKVNPANSGEYEYRGAWRKFETRKEKIGIAGGKSVEKEIRFTVHGPVISGFRKIKEHVVSMHWIGNEMSNELRTVYLLNRAKDWNDFRNAVRSFISISQNIVYADVNGNIGLYCSAGIPIRRKGNGLGLVPGWTGEYDWQGFVPFERQPHVYNPASGYVVSANNKTVGDRYPYFIGHWYEMPWRYDRIKEMLEAKEKLSVADFMAIQTDQHSKLAMSMRDDIVSAMKAEEAALSPFDRRVLSMFAAWDGEVRGDSAAAALFEKFYVSFLSNCFKDEIGEELYKDFVYDRVLGNFAVDALWRNKKSEWFDDVATKDKKEGFSDMISRSFRESTAWLKSELGGDPVKWRWEKIHPFTLFHPLGSVRLLDLLFNLNRGPYKVGGSFHTVCPYGYMFGDPFIVTDGASERHIFPASDWDKSLTVIPTGISGIPASDFYCDQVKLYVKGEYHPDYLSRNLVEKAARFTLTLVP